MQPLHKKITQHLHKKIMQPLHKKIPKPLCTKKITQPLHAKKIHNLHKNKSCNLNEWLGKIMQLLNTKHCENCKTLPSPPNFFATFIFYFYFLSTFEKCNLTHLTCDVFRAAFLQFSQFFYTFKKKYIYKYF